MAGDRDSVPSGLVGNGKANTWSHKRITLEPVPGSDRAEQRITVELFTNREDAFAHAVDTFPDKNRDPIVDEIHGPGGKMFVRQALTPYEPPGDWSPAPDED